MSDELSKSTTTRPSTPLKQENVTSPLSPVEPGSSASVSPEESQVPEPPPRGGQQPGEDIAKA